MTSSTLSKDAEDSSNLINDTLSAHRESIDSITGRGGRKRRLPGSGVDREQIQRQATLIRFLSIVESFCTERLLVEMDAIIPSEDASIGSKAKRHVAVQKIWDDSHGRAIASWDILHKTYHGWLAVPKSAWKQIIELTDARNAVAHGHGQLTWKQKRGGLQEIENLRKHLATHEISLDGNQLVLTEQSVTHAAKLCRDFILELDEILRGKRVASTASAPTS